MEWHWIKNGDTPRPKSTVLTIKWNEQTMSSEARVFYEVDTFDYENYTEGGFYKARTVFKGDKPYYKTVAWCYIDKPSNLWDEVVG